VKRICMQGRTTMATRRDNLSDSISRLKNAKSEAAFAKMFAEKGGDPDLVKRLAEIDRLMDETIEFGRVRLERRRA
jgi:hypothetical protein